MVMWAIGVRHVVSTVGSVLSRHLWFVNLPNMFLTLQYMCCLIGINKKISCAVNGILWHCLSYVTATSSTQFLSIYIITICLYRYVVYKDITMVLSSNIPVHFMDDYILNHFPEG